MFDLFSYTLDGEKAGLAARMQNGKYVEGVNHSRLFRNMEVLKSQLYFRGISNPDLYEIELIAPSPTGKGSIVIPYSNARRETELYYSAVYRGAMIRFTSVYEKKLISMGYFVFGDGDVNLMTDFTKGKEINAEILHDVRFCSYELTKHPYYNMSAIKDNNYPNKYYLKANNSTAEVYICNCKQLFNLNEIRKNDGKKCIPFIKTMDRFKTVPIYAVKDINDGKHADNTAEEIRDNILDYLRSNRPDDHVRYVSNEIKSTVIL